MEFLKKIHNATSTYAIRRHNGYGLGRDENAFMASTSIYGQ